MSNWKQRLLNHFAERIGKAGSTQLLHIKIYETSHNFLKRYREKRQSENNLRWKRQYNILAFRLFATDQKRSQAKNKQTNHSEVFTAIEDSGILTLFGVKISLTLLKGPLPYFFSKTDSVNRTFDQTSICDNLAKVLQQNGYQTLRWLSWEQLRASKTPFVEARSKRLLVLFFLLCICQTVTGSFKWDERRSLTNIFRRGKTLAACYCY